LKIKFGLSAIAFTIADFVEQGVVAERSGFDSVWIPDHFTDLPPSNDKYEPWTVLATIGAKTQRLLLGTLATDCARRHPASVAHVTATLDNLTQGRVILGIGAGEAMNITPYGLPWEDPDTRVKRLEESVKIMRLLWKSTQTAPVNFQGQFYHLKDARLDLHPYNERNLPVYIAALGSKRSLQLTGRLGDGWLPWFNTPETFIERMSIIDRAAEKSGRSADQIDKTAVVYLALSDDHRKQQQILDSMKAEIVVLTSSTRLAKLGHDVDAQTMDYSYQKCLASNEDTELANKLGSSLPDSVAEQFLVSVNVRVCIERLEELVNAGARHLIIRNMLWANRLEDFHSTLDRIGREVIPAFS
jgi:alkanesulfonate monooxygenase SsuD/methylene tetrahydromethanopterin reductase-like flavin-dependent oxidoreductase (luciferase family)